MLKLVRDFLDYRKQRRRTHCLVPQIGIPALLMLVNICGCRRDGGVELVENVTGTPRLEVEYVGNDQAPTNPAIEDSTGYLLTSASTYYGTLNVAGSEYDGLNEHHEASVAKAAFYMSSEPIVVSGATVAYHLMVPNLISVDNILLHNIIRTYSADNLYEDTLGVEYSLLTRDGSGDGFQYVGNHRYTWIVGDSISPFDTITIVSPPDVHVVSPAAEDAVSLNADVHMRWSGGGSYVRIIISDVETDQYPKSILRIRVTPNTGSVTIPAELLRVLPRQRMYYLWSLSSASSSVTRIHGYGDNVLVNAEHIHNLLLRVRD